MGHPFQPGWPYSSFRRSYPPRIQFLSFSTCLLDISFSQGGMGLVQRDVCSNTRRNVEDCCGIYTVFVYVLPLTQKYSKKNKWNSIQCSINPKKNKLFVLDESK